MTPVEIAFGARLEIVLLELGIPQVEWGTFLLGFVYTELRRSFSVSDARALIDETLADIENRLE